MRNLILLCATVAFVLVGSADARARHPRAPREPKVSSTGRHHRGGIGEIGTVGPSSFHPVKRWKGFSYLQHEKHPDKED